MHNHGHTHKDHGDAIQWVCGECMAARVDPSLQTKDPASFIGKYVKRGFPTGLSGPGQPTVEHMWVKISSVKDGVLRGRLANDPLYIRLRCGHRVDVLPEQIEAVQD